MKATQSFLTITSFLATAFLVGLCLTSCHTTRGLGKDMEKLGEEIQGEAIEHTNY